MRRAVLLLLTTAVLAVVSAAAAAPVSVDVGMGEVSFAPRHDDVLVGDTVRWTNTSSVDHTVTSSAAGFDSGTLPPGAVFTHTFSAAGHFDYLCKFHLPYMRGDVDVRRILLASARRLVVKGSSATLSGRAAGGITSVTIQDDRGGEFQAPVDSGGRFTATVRPAATARYHAVAGGDTSQVVEVRVTPYALRAKPRLRRTAAIVSISAVEPHVGERVAVQVRRGGRWRRVARGRLSSHSRARLKVRRTSRTVRARAVLLRSGKVAGKSRTFRVKRRS